MSLLSPEPRIALLPGCAGLALGRHTPRVRTSAQGGLAALEELLAGQAGWRGRARVTLSHHFAHLFLLPPPPVRLRRREMRPWLEAQLADTLDKPTDWHLTWDLAAPGRPILTGAVQHGLIDGLTAVLKRHGLGLSAVRPWLAQAWDRRRLGRVSGWYALLEPGRITALRLAGGTPVILRQRPLGDDAAADLLALLTRENLLAGLDNAGEIWLEQTGVPGDWSRLGGRLHPLAGPADPGLALLP